MPEEPEEHVRYEVAEGIATLTLNRPEVLNAYQPRMGDQLVAGFARAREDAAVRAVILCGAGRAFCAGVDLPFLREMAAREARGETTVRVGEEHFVRGFAAELAAYPKPVLAAMQGAAVGIGVTMTLACDVRIAAEDARLSLPFTKLGMMPGLGSTQLLPRLVGLGNALDLVLSSRSIDAREALAMGLVQRVVPGDRLLPETRELAARMAACDPGALAAAKRALHRNVGVPLADALAEERRLATELRQLRGRS